MIAPTTPAVTVDVVCQVCGAVASSVGQQATHENDRKHRREVVWVER